MFIIFNFSLKMGKATEKLTIVVLYRENYIMPV